MVLSQAFELRDGRWKLMLLNRRDSLPAPDAFDATGLHLADVFPILDGHRVLIDFT